MPIALRPVSWCAFALMALVAQGCATGPAKQTVAPTAIIAAQAPVPEGSLLDVGIHILEVPKADADGKSEDGSNAEIRAAEARFIPFHLKQTLQRTGYWGAVRVVPQRAEEVDVGVRGTLIESNGETLTVRFKVADATGRVWFDNEYSAAATGERYNGLPEKDQDPYQDLYNQVANDMLVHLRKLTPQDIATVRRVAMLKFARSIVPYAFAEYLAQDGDGATRVSRLPADGDPMFERIMRIREREYMFIDTVNQYYGNLYSDMRQPYGQWRKSYFDEATRKRELENQAMQRRLLGVAAIVGAVLVGNRFRDSAAGDVARGVMVIGGVEVFRSGNQFARDAKIHEDAIKELGASFKGDVAPIVDEVEGRTVKLSGSVETQYAEWRRLLRELFTVETGRAPEVDALEAGASDKGSPPGAENSVR